MTAVFHWLSKPVLLTLPTDLIKLARRKNKELSVRLLRYREKAVVSIVDSLLGRELSVSWNNCLYMVFAKIRLTEMQQ